MSSYLKKAQGKVMLIVYNKLGKFATMRLFALLIGLFAFTTEMYSQTSASGDVVKSQQDIKPNDTVLIKQPNGPAIHVVGYGGMFIRYSETIDGYTLALNGEGLYEYASLGLDGDLSADGILAHDPKDRDAMEKAHLSMMSKHLRYKDPKLTKLLDRQKKYDHPVYVPNYNYRFKPNIKPKPKN